ncbi:MULTISPECIES: hypothetical protein [unclassified Shewanella]|uniref:hypothetical protein n=1 Tax=unclassified Shewanella TaxID=196818 RepID=UPI000C838E40|nr:MULTISPECIES: hypothetical protein [unclassified Shewanella]MDO6619988.1 hypothetical protein [Shewanella sp. 6_MG-2023]MDO6639526.1 hypothetical protein [Shewanella sp. 5_MG-2023]MDO6677995.1 hypothetical protein [Shewanella sp. 4_MG-2023]PMG30533.1 hypothetical protein BCU94_11065 [Shewanella sp. 10N.286.52.C2]PMG52447.1 hypothetical protein BCU91_00140 [Shewanella sp. 10N.286.52.B9]
MALSRKKWNNILIIACVFMVAVLTFIDSKTNQMPDDAQALFDETNQLTQLQFDDIWLNKGANGWVCSASVLNCRTLAEAWSQLAISPTSISDAERQQLPAAQSLVIAINHTPQGQLWQYYPQYGLLQSAADNWYQIPPSLRTELIPIIASQTQE